MIHYTDNPERDFARYDSEQQEQLEKLPVCCECGEPIQDEHCFEIDSGYVCPGCMDDNHKVCVDLLMN